MPCSDIDSTHCQHHIKSTCDMMIDGMERVSCTEHDVQGMTKASAHTSWGPFFTAAELAEIPECLQAALLGSPWRPDLCNYATAGTVLHATAMFAPNGMRLPRFISWVLPFR